MSGRVVRLASSPSTCTIERYGSLFNRELNSPSLWPELVVHLGIDPLQRPPQVRGVAEGDVVLCESPGVMAPGFTPVLVSNDGASFTDPAKVGKRVDYLFMESSMYGDGSDGSGANVDGVCAPLKEREKEGERAVTFGGWFCPDCGPPLVRLD
jgi:hypothetical protein